MKNQEFIDTDLSPSKLSGSASGRDMNPSAQSQSRAEIDARVELARQQMLELRRQQEELERQRLELEELRRREEDFEKGKAEMLEELSRSVSRIEQEEFEINKKGTTLANCREVFQDYIRQLQNIHEAEWSGDELKSQLAKAISVVESAKAELNKGRAQLDFLGSGPLRLENDVTTGSKATEESASTSVASGDFDFVLEIKRGLALSLPLLLGLLIILLFVFSKGGK